MGVAAEIGRNSVSKHQTQLEYGERAGLRRDGTAEHVSRDQILRGERGQGNIHFPCLADHMQDWQPYLVDLYSATVYVTTIHLFSEQQLVHAWKIECFMFQILIVVVV